MGRKNALLARQQKELEVWKRAIEETTEQILADTMQITLNEFGFGEKRIREIMEAWGKNYTTFYPAISKSMEADYYQAKLDERLKAIVKSGDFIPFEKRYDWLKEERYGEKG